MMKYSEVREFHFRSGIEQGTVLILDMLLFGAQIKVQYRGGKDAQDERGTEQFQVNAYVFAWTDHYACSRGGVDLVVK